MSMQVTQTSADGLTRQFRIVVPAADLASRADAQLNDLKGKVKINGFRPGKVPVAHLKRLYGRSVMADIVNSMVGEGNRRIVDENQIKLAMEPRLDFEGGDQGVQSVIEGKGDFAWTVSVEVLPSFEVGDLSGIAIEKPVAAIEDGEIDEAVQNLARRNRSYTDRPEGEAAQDGDRLTVDFTGRIDGEVFEGGTGTDIAVELGSNSFIPGFEGQLVGARSGEERQVNVEFPAEYPAAQLAGKAATFDVTVKAVQAPGELSIDDALATSVGLDSLDKLRGVIRDSISRDHEAASRRKVKRQLLDALDTRFTFDLPPSLLEQEFANVWRQVETDMGQSKRSFEDEGTTEDKAREEYRAIAARRVRLGLVLAEVGERAGVKVTDEEVTRGLYQRASQFPGQEKMVFDFYRQNPQALAELRAPIFEDKVVDHLLGQASVTEKTVSKEELRAEDEESPFEGMAVMEEGSPEVEAAVIAADEAGEEPAQE